MTEYLYSIIADEFVKYKFRYVYDLDEVDHYTINLERGIVHIKICIYNDKINVHTSVLKYCCHHYDFFSVGIDVFDLDYLIDHVFQWVNMPDFISKN